MRLICSALIVLGVFVATPTIADYHAYGAGLKSCGTWTQKRKSKDWYEAGQWVLGYITAYGYYGSDNLKDVEAPGMAAWLDNYCQQNPLESIETATQKLIETLKMKKQ